MSNTIRRIAGLLAALLITVGLGVFALQAPASAGPLTNLFGPYTIRPAANIGQCMDVRDVSYSNGALLQTYQCLGSQQTNQVFYFWKVEGSASYYQVTPAHSWKCLDIRDVSNANYAPVQQYDCLGATQYNQIFDASESPDHYLVLTPIHSWKPVAYGQGGINGASVYQCYICAGSAVWYLFPA